MGDVWVGFRILPWVCSAASFYVARTKNRRAVLWAFLGFFILPFIVLLFLSKVEKKEAGGYQVPTVPYPSAPPPSMPSPPPSMPSPSPSPPPPVATAPPRPQPVSSAANVCPSCQTANSPGASFCAGCGRDLRLPASPRKPKVSYCSNCGEPISEGAHFCPKCGHQVT